MQYLGLLSVVAVLAVIGWWFVLSVPPAPSEETVTTNEVVDPAITAHIQANADVITLTTPVVNGVVASPLAIQGEARGQWFFEASFPVVIVDWDGKIIAETHAQATGDWMTTEFVPFSATIEFDNPYHDGMPEYQRHGTLILRRDNPSGLPENDNALEIPILFAAQQTTEAAHNTTYGEAIDAANTAAGLLGE